MPQKTSTLQVLLEIKSLYISLSYKHLITDDRLTYPLLAIEKKMQSGMHSTLLEQCIQHLIPCIRDPR